MSLECRDSRLLGDCGNASLLALGVGRGDEVITTPMTFVATLNTIVDCGAVPVLADIDRATLNVRVEEVEKKIGPKTRAIVPVHYVGQPADLDALLDAARPQGIPILEDAAHAVGAEFSFYRERFGWRPEDFPESHFVSERIVSLPLFPGLTDSDQDDAIEAVRTVFARFAR